MSSRDIEAAFGISRRLQAQCLALAAIPEEEFNQLFRRDIATPRELEKLVRRRARKLTNYTRRCPHCHMPLRIEDSP
jgi:hypothetical protein